MKQKNLPDLLEGDLFSFRNLYKYYQKARRGKTYKLDVMNFHKDLEKNLLQLKDELENGTYRHGNYREFIVCDSKKREIKAAPFRDRIVHYLVYDFLQKKFNKSFIYDSYACRKGKGLHKGVKRLQTFLRSIKGKRLSRSEKLSLGITEREEKDRMYCLKCDVSKYFDSIDHQILFTLISKRVENQRILWLVKEIIESYNKEKGWGIPIGNLTSQIFANIYLNKMDQHIKRELSEKYYIRYMDDFLVLGASKKHLHRLKEHLEDFLESELKLIFNPKKAEVFPVDKGVDFLGYVIFEQYKRLRKDTVKRFIKRTKRKKVLVKEGRISLKKFYEGLRSWSAYARFGNSYKLRKDLYTKLGIFEV